MKTSQEKQWDMLQQIIAADAADKPIKLSSTKTLFGIKSHVEEVIDKAAKEDSERCLKKLQEQNNIR